MKELEASALFNSFFQKQAKFAKVIVTRENFEHILAQLGEMQKEIEATFKVQSLRQEFHLFKEKYTDLHLYPKAQSEIDRLMGYLSQLSSVLSRVRDVLERYDEIAERYISDMREKIKNKDIAPSEIRNALNIRYFGQVHYQPDLYSDFVNEIEAVLAQSPSVESPPPGQPASPPGGVEESKQGTTTLREIQARVNTLTSKVRASDRGWIKTLPEKVRRAPRITAEKGSVEAFLIGLGSMRAEIRGVVEYRSFQREFGTLQNEFSSHRNFYDVPEVGSLALLLSYDGDRELNRLLQDEKTVDEIDKYLESIQDVIATPDEDLIKDFDESTRRLRVALNLELMYDILNETPDETTLRISPKLESLENLRRALGSTTSRPVVSLPREVAIYYHADNLKSLLKRAMQDLEQYLGVRFVTYQRAPSPLILYVTNAPSTRVEHVVSRTDLDMLRTTNPNVMLLVFRPGVNVQPSDPIPGIQHTFEIAYVPNQPLDLTHSVGKTNQETIESLKQQLGESQRRTPPQPSDPRASSGLTHAVEKTAEENHLIFKFNAPSDVRAWIHFVMSMPLAFKHNTPPITPLDHVISAVNPQNPQPPEDRHTQEIGFIALSTLMRSNQIDRSKIHYLDSSSHFTRPYIACFHVDIDKIENNESFKGKYEVVCEIFLNADYVSIALIKGRKYLFDHQGHTTNVPEDMSGLLYRLYRRKPQSGGTRQSRRLAISYSV